jgi:hypothetical protein
MLTEKTTIPFSANSANEHSFVIKLNGFARSCDRPPKAQWPRFEEYMCPACISSTAALIAGVSSTGGILAVCIGKFRNFFITSGLSLFKSKER